MAKRPRLLDLFCGAGGAAMGYWRAGFDILGVDNRSQPRYPFPFVQADALLYASLYGHFFDGIHASPPCQAHVTMSNRWRGYGGIADGHRSLIAPTRAIIRWRPYVLENVVGARSHLQRAIIMSGGDGLRVARPRLFESNHPLLGRTISVADPLGVYGKAPDGRRLFDRKDGSIQRAASSVEVARLAMGIDWPMTWDEVKEAIPPAYTEFIGRQLIEYC